MSKRAGAFAAGLECIHCGHKEDLGDKTYVCSKCGANLKVVYDWEGVKKALTRESLAKNEDRTIWRYLPILPVSRRLDGPPVGWSPMVDAPRLAKELGLKSLKIKDDGKGPSASFKDRPSAVALMRAVDLGLDLVTGASNSGDQPTGGPSSRRETGRSGR